MDPTPVAPPEIPRVFMDCSDDCRVTFAIHLLGFAFYLVKNYDKPCTAEDMVQLSRALHSYDLKEISEFFGVLITRTADRVLCITPSKMIRPRTTSYFRWTVFLTEAEWDEILLYMIAVLEPLPPQTPLVLAPRVLATKVARALDQAQD